MSASVHTKTSTFYLKKVDISSRSGPASETLIYKHLSGSSGFSSARSIASSGCTCCKVVSSRWFSSLIGHPLLLDAIWDMVPDEPGEMAPPVELLNLPLEHLAILRVVLAIEELFTTDLHKDVGPCVIERSQVDWPVLLAVHCSGLVLFSMGIVTTTVLPLSIGWERARMVILSGRFILCSKKSPCVKDEMKLPSFISSVSLGIFLPFTVKRSRNFLGFSSYLYLISSQLLPPLRTCSQILELKRLPLEPEALAHPEYISGSFFLDLSSESYDPSSSQAWDNFRRWRRSEYESWLASWLFRLTSSSSSLSSWRPRQELWRVEPPASSCSGGCRVSRAFYLYYSSAPLDFRGMARVSL
ncbi:hypothetical protein Nepgr_005152 [Nepenthes gracilis]|uniref:Uncharacterized protein n=1 Tax=Nepenthes gracilis TaxID=150966 RepID=A0AAD3XG31_NEPGR|nr:hypothetical protein Nepgr_005152 [Nepenthes gracilis]